jgi:hypothetical protein
MDRKQLRQKIALKIQALLKKTVQNGATEAEALSAAEIAARLMKDCGHEELRREFASASYGARGKPCGVHEVRFVGNAIARFTNTIFWEQGLYEGKKKIGRSYSFFGSAEDTETAINMMALLQAAMETEWASYFKSPRRDKSVHGKTLRLSFMSGMAFRLIARLDGLLDLRRDNPTSNAVVVVKDDVVKQMFGAFNAAQNREIVVVKPTYNHHDDSFAAGDEAGAKVDLGMKKFGKDQARIGST